MMRRKRSLFYRTITAKQLRIGRAFPRRGALLWLIGLLIVASLLGVLIFEAGRYVSSTAWSGNTKEKLDTLTQENKKLKEELESYRKAAESADTAIALAKASEQKTQEEVQRLTKALEEANDDLAFFQKIASPNNTKTEGISIRNMEAKRLGGGGYHLRALLYLSGTQVKNFSGYAEWFIDQNGRQVPIAMEEESKETLNFSRYRRLDKTFSLLNGPQPRQASLKIYDQSGNLKAQMTVQIIR